MLLKGSTQGARCRSATCSTQAGSAPRCLAAQHYRHRADAPWRNKIFCRAVQGATATQDASEAILLTDNALNHLKRLQAEKGRSNMLLRVGVKQGGCSGMSYAMDFEAEENIKTDDYIMHYDSGALRLVTDPKSLLYLFGMRLDYSNALIGGGFQFHNPNATDTCGCGKSFGV